MPHSGANGAFNYAQMDAQYVELSRQLSSFGLMYLHLVNFIERKGIHPLIGHRFDFGNARDAFARQIKGPEFGKIVIIF